MSPSIIHMMHFPWDKNQTLKPNPEDFDRTSYDAMRAYAVNFETRLWTYPKARDFCTEHYPDIWKTLQTVNRPVMLVDVLRWVVIYHFGGIYWQMNATPLRAMSAYLPADAKGVRLFTEFILSEEKCRAMANEPIRNGEAEEPTRVLIQAFSARPREPFIKKTIEFLLDRVRKYTPKKDYDILYITGNAAVSTAYDHFGKNDPAVELMGLDESKRMIKWHYSGSWRKDAPEFKSPPKTTQGARPTRLDRLPTLGAVLYYWRKHSHAEMLIELDKKAPRHACTPQIVDWIHERGIKSVYEAPSGLINMPTVSAVKYEFGDPTPAVVMANRKKDATARCCRVNMLYSKFPTAELFICANFLELLPHSEVLRVLRRIIASKPRYIALTGYQFLNHSWDTALGDFRPVCFHLAPFQFPAPQEILRLPTLASSRPDRCLMVWQAADLARALSF